MKIWYQIHYVSYNENIHIFHNPLRYTKKTAHIPSMVAMTKLMASSNREARNIFLDSSIDVKEIIRILPLELIIDNEIYNYVGTNDPEGVQRDIAHYSDKGLKHRKMKNKQGDYHLYISLDRRYKSK